MQTNSCEAVHPNRPLRPGATSIFLPRELAHDRAVQVLIHIRVDPHRASSWAYGAGVKCSSATLAKAGLVVLEQRAKAVAEAELATLACNHAVLMLARQQVTQSLGAITLESGR
jgi:hypothetical protein